MSHEADKFWQKAAQDLARQARLAPLTPEQAQKECLMLPHVELSGEEIECIIDQVTSGELTVWTPTPREEDTPNFDSAAIEEDVLQLNRNEGQADAEINELLNELRRKALEDGQTDGKEDPTGMGGDAEPPRTGG
jgi:hypothetical protein